MSRPRPPRPKKSTRGDRTTTPCPLRRTRPDPALPASPLPVISTAHVASEVPFTPADAAGRLSIAGLGNTPFEINEYHLGYVPTRHTAVAPQYATEFHLNSPYVSTRRQLYE